MRLLRMSVSGLPRAMVIPPVHSLDPLPTSRRRSRWIAWFWLLPPRSEIAWPPVPVIVSPRSGMNFDCWKRTPWPLVHWVVGGGWPPRLRGGERGQRDEQREGQEQASSHRGTL